MLEALAVAFHDPYVYGAVTLVVRSYWVLCTGAAVVALLPPRRGVNWFRYVDSWDSLPPFGPTCMAESHRRHARLA